MSSTLVLHSHVHVFTGAMTAPTNAAKVLAARNRMRHVGDMMQAEFAVLVDKNGTVLAAPDCPELQGTPWNPAGTHY
jgi:hypothetical protein